MTDLIQPVRLRVQEKVIHDGKLYLPGESTIVELELATAIAVEHPEAQASWTDYAAEKRDEDARAAASEGAG